MPHWRFRADHRAAHRAGHRADHGVMWFVDLPAQLLTFAGMQRIKGHLH